MPRLSHSTYHLRNIRWGEKIKRLSSYCSFLQPSPNILYTTLFLITLGLWPPRNLRDAVSRPATKCMHMYIYLYFDLCACYVNTFAASYLNTQGLNNSCLKSPASTLVDLSFQSRALRSFSLNQLRNLSL